MVASRPYKLKEGKTSQLEAMYRRVLRIRDAKWPVSSDRPSGTEMADYVTRKAKEHDLQSGGQGAKITLCQRAIARVCDETYQAKVFR